VPFQTPLTIETVLDKIYAQEYVLPAIQREFAWDTDQVIRLFDSLMRAYPIGAFLFWNVKADEETDDDADRDFVFYGFIRNYHERNAPHCPKLDVPKTRAVTAILDGQQRLTALNIGLRGSHAEKLPGKWRDNPNAYPVKHLYLNIEQPAGENDLGMEYDFSFLAEGDAKDRGTSWFRVGEILRFDDLTEIHEYLLEIGLVANRFAFKTLSRLHAMVKSDLAISYYDENAQDLDKVLNIFIRVNSGGTPLSYSDLLLSIATAQWKERDARDAIHGLVDDLNNAPLDFAFSQDLILKAGLVLTDTSDIRFKVTNFNRANMTRLEREWDGVSGALHLAARLLANFGFSDLNLHADSPLVPIAYYLARRGADDAYLTAVKHSDDRNVIRRWVIRSLLKQGIWGSGLDTLLNALRRAFQQSPTDLFPVDALEAEMAGLGKSLVFTREEINDLLDTQYASRRSFPLLSILYPSVEVRGQFHEDHVFPKSRFTARRLLEAGVQPDRVEGCLARFNRLPNLQLLDGPVNIAKLNAMPMEWARSTYPNEVQRLAYLALHDLDGLPENLDDFIDFYEARRSKISARLSELLLAPEGSSSITQADEAAS
jgi:hypothetical protein